MSTVEDLIARFTVVLGAEEDAYRRLRDVLRREEEELVALDPAALDATTAEKQAIASEARLHEQNRLALTRSLAVAVGLDGTPRLSELIELLGEEAASLAPIHTRLSALIESTRDLLASNERFAHRSLSRVQGTLRMLGQAVPEATGYGPGAPRSGQSGRGRIVRASI